MKIKVEALEKSFVVKSGSFFNKTKSTVDAVKNVSFEVNDGEIVAFIGPNGAGKSTTIKMMTGIIQTSSGEISVGGFNPVTERKEMSYHIGCMFGQKSQLSMHLTVRDSLKLLCSIYDMSSSEADAKIEEIAKMFKIEEFLDRTVRKLSLGQRMICEIAGCIMHDPEVIFLDEPTIGLDVFAKARIREIIKKLNREKGTTIILTSHDLGDVEALCERIIIINNGTIVNDSSMNELKFEYLSTKIVNIFYDETIVNQEFKYPVECVEGNNVVLSVDTKSENMGDVLSYFTSLGSISDIQITSTPLEEVIKNIYRKKV